MYLNLSGNLLLVHTYIYSLPQEARVGYILLIMATYWCTLCVPLFITGVIPIFTFPLMGILTAQEVAAQYMKVISSLWI